MFWIPKLNLAGTDFKPVAIKNRLLPQSSSVTATKLNGGELKLQFWFLAGSILACRGGRLSAFVRTLTNPAAIRRAAARRYKNNTDDSTLTEYQACTPSTRFNPQPNRGLHATLPNEVKTYPTTKSLS